MPKKSATVDQSDFARAALVTEGVAFGNALSVVDEGDDTVTYLFENKLKGYQAWTWQVTLYQPKGQEPTVSELLLLPGEGALVAPAWVPWSERLADYKALQAELEAQAAEDEDTEEYDLEDAAEELLAAESEQGEEPESDAEDAGVRPPRSRNRNRGRKHNKKSEDETPNQDSE